VPLEGRVNGRQLQNALGRGGEDLAAIRRAVSALLSREISRMPLRHLGRGTREMSGAASTAGHKTSSTLDDSVIVFE